MALLWSGRYCCVLTSHTCFRSVWFKYFCSLRKKRRRRSRESEAAKLQTTKVEYRSTNACVPKNRLLCTRCTFQVTSRDNDITKKKTHSGAATPPRTRPLPANIPPTEACTSPLYFLPTTTIDNKLRHHAPPGKARGAERRLLANRHDARPGDSPGMGDARGPEARQTRQSGGGGGGGSINGSKRRIAR